MSGAERERGDTTNDELVVGDNPSLDRFELRIGDLVAFLSYRRSTATLELVHTEVPEAIRHRGIADRLVAAAFEHARSQGLTVVPICPFVRDYVKRHPELQPLVSKIRSERPPDHRAAR